MKLHDLKPAPGSRTARTRVGRGIAAGQGKTAGRGTKGQKARAGGSIQPWFEGGQTPLHMRIPKLRGFKNRFKIEYEIVNVGRIAELAALGAFEAGDLPGGSKPAKAVPITVNQEILRAVGLVRTLDKPLKVLGQGDIEMALFVVADAFSKSAVAKIEAAGGAVQALQIPSRSLPALGLEPTAEAASETAPKPKASPKAKAKAGPDASSASVAESAEVAETEPVAAAVSADAPAAQSESVPVASDAPEAPAEKPARAARPKAAKTDAGSAAAVVKSVKTGAGSAAKPKPKAKARPAATVSPEPTADPAPAADDAPVGEDA